MKTNYIYSLATTFITAALALGSFTAFSNEDSVVDTMPGGVSSAAAYPKNVNLASINADFTSQTIHGH